MTGSRPPKCSVVDTDLITTLHELSLLNRHPRNSSTSFRQKILTGSSSDRNNFALRFEIRPRPIKRLSARSSKHSLSTGVNL